MTETDYYELINADATVRVLFADEGEGKYGYYDEDDPDDTPLLRFCVDFRNEDGEWEAANDASYCTNVHADTEPTRVRELLHTIMANVDGKIGPDGSGIKKICEQLSWLSA
jgi:hypothetical protein